MDSLENNGRTRGDGMENNSTIVNKDTTTVEIIPAARIESTLSSKFPATPHNVGQFQPSNVDRFAASLRLGENLIYRDSSSPPKCLPAVLPKGKIFYLVPRLVTPKKPLRANNKEPKFVPFEPYKAAVKPIMPIKPVKIKLNRKNNLDLNTLVSHMSSLKSSSMKDIDLSSAAIESELEKQKMYYEKQIKDLKKDRDIVANQLKSQVQVNTELKNLLVAAVGEDLQTRVNLLTEDKLHLARELLTTAQSLSSHTEQIEYLAGQSEVWRSKFLASSLMVEELARWKAALTHKNKLLLESNKQMLETMSTVREMEIEALKNFKFLSQIKTLQLPSSNVLDLASECLNISQELVLHSGYGMPANIDVTGLDPNTEAEKIAIEALQISNEPLMSPDVAFKAIVGQAFPASVKNVDDASVSK